MDAVKDAGDKPGPSQPPQTDLVSLGRELKRQQDARIHGYDPQLMTDKQYEKLMEFHRRVHLDPDVMIGGRYPREFGLEYVPGYAPYPSQMGTPQGTTGQGPYSEEQVKFSKHVVKLRPVLGTDNFHHEQPPKEEIPEDKKARRKFLHAKRKQKNKEVRALEKEQKKDMGIIKQFMFFARTHRGLWFAGKKLERAIFLKEVRNSVKALDKQLIALRRLQMNTLFGDLKKINDDLLVEIHLLKIAAKHSYEVLVFHLVQLRMADEEITLTTTKRQLTPFLKALDELEDKGLIYNKEREEFALYVSTELKRRLPEKDPRFKGKMRPMGSTASEIMAGSKADFDVTFMIGTIDLDTDDFEVDTMEHNFESYQIKPVTQKARDTWSDVLNSEGNLDVFLFYLKFLALVTDVMKEIPLPKNIEYGGFLRPYFSGARPYYPGVGIRYLADGKEDITLIVKPAIKVPISMYNDIFGLAPVALQRHFGSSEKAQKLDALLFTPKDSWHISTTQAQVQLLKMFKSDSVLKKSIRHMKRIRSNFLSFPAPDLSEAMDLIIAEMVEIMESKTEKELLKILEIIGALDLELFMLFGRAYAIFAQKEGFTEDDTILQRIIEIQRACVTRCIEEVDPAVLNYLDENVGFLDLVSIPSVNFVVMILNMYLHAAQHGNEVPYFDNDNEHVEKAITQEALLVYRHVLVNEASVQFVLDNEVYPPHQLTTFATNLFEREMGDFHTAAVDEVLEYFQTAI